MKIKKSISRKMTIYLQLFVFVFVCFPRLETAYNVPTDPAVHQNVRVYKFVNGQWYNGKDFRRETFYSVDGMLTKAKPREVDETIDLENHFVIPPFGDAHTHNLDGTYNLDKMIKAYLAEGTFYVQVLTNHASGALAAKPFLNKSSSLD